MKIRLRHRALSDLNEIGAYLTPISPQGAVNLKAAILATFETLRLWPHAGKPQTTPGVRKLGVARYPYNIFYGVDEAAAEIVVFTIFHTSHDSDYSNS